MDKFSFLGAAHSGMIEDMYDKYLQDPNSIEEEWTRFFQGYEFFKTVYGENHVSGFLQKEFRVINLIDAYRKRGHLFTKTNPVRERRRYFPTLELSNFGMQESDLDIEFQAGEDVGIGTSTPRALIEPKYLHCPSYFRSLDVV